jgi:hypothetical protein
VSRTISATNLAEINADHLHEVILVELAFDTPLYVHSGVGTITYDSNDYLGVGAYGGIAATTESERLTPTNLTLQLSGIDSTHITEALDAGRYGDIVTIRVGYRDDDGALVDDPWTLWRGFFEFAAIQQGESVTVLMTLQHDLSVLSEINGGRYTDEDQQTRFSGDLGLEYVTDQNGLKIIWGGGRVVGGASGGSGGYRPVEVK